MCTRASMYTHTYTNVSTRSLRNWFAQVCICARGTGLHKDEKQQLVCTNAKSKVALSKKVLLERCLLNCK